MNSSDQSSSNKPQIFINHVDLSITEDEIKQACETMNTKPTSITIRKNHDQKSNNVIIAFATENEAKTLKGTNSTLVVKNVPLKLEEYQNIQPRNVFMKNIHSLTEEQLHDGVKKLIKGQFDMTQAYNSVFFFIQDPEDIEILINQQHEINGKPVRFEKTEKNHSKSNKNTQLYIKFTNLQNINPQNIQTQLEKKYQNSISAVTHFSSNDKGMHFGSNQVQSTTPSVTFSVSFNDSKQAEELHNELKEKGSLYDHPVTVQWKRPEDSDDRTVFLKFLNIDTTEQQLQNAIQKYGEVLSIELVSAPEIPNKPRTKSAYVIMSTESGCKYLMDQGFADEQLKLLFSRNKPNISPYISKNELNLYKNAVRSNNPIHPQAQFQQNQFFNQFQQYPPQMQMPYPPFFAQIAPYGYTGMVPQNQPRNQGHPHQYKQFQQQNQYNMNYQPNHQYKKQGGNYKNNPGHHNNYQNQNQNFNHNNNNNQNYRYQQQTQPKASQQLLTQQQLQQELANNPGMFDTIAKEQAKELVTQHLNRDAQKKSFLPYVGQIVEMLTDKDVFEPSEIIALIIDEKELSARIEEGIELIKESQTGQN